MTDINFLRSISNINNNIDINSIQKKQNTNNDTYKSSSTEETKFSNLLKEKCLETTITFSKHATERIEQRSIEINDSVASKLNEASEQARTKGLKNILVMIDSAAFIVNTLSNKVITAVGNDDLKENIFTNIDGAVIK